MSLVLFLCGAIHKGCPHIRGEGGQAKVDKCGQGEGMVSQMWASAWKKYYSYHTCEIYSDNLGGSMSVYKIFILLAFNRECMERNVMTLFRILPSFECFFTLFSNKNNYNKIFEIFKSPFVELE